MSKKPSETWHLSTNEEEQLITDFELNLWRVFYGFLRWQETCHEAIAGELLSGHELAILHIIKMNDKPKDIYGISRILNRDDPHNVQYSISKLIKQGLVKKDKGIPGKKISSYTITSEGTSIIEKFVQARQEMLIETYKKEGLDNLNLKEFIKSLQKIKVIYDDSGFLVETYNP